MTAEPAIDLWKDFRRVLNNFELCPILIMKTDSEQLEFLISEKMRAQTTGIETGDCSPKSAFFTIDLAAVTLNIAKGKNIRTQVRTQRGGRKPAPLLRYGRRSCYDEIRKVLRSRTLFRCRKWLLTVFWMEFQGGCYESRDSCRRPWHTHQRGKLP